MNTNKLLERYSTGERDFRFANLAGADLCGANLTGANLAVANLAGANLFQANLTEVKLREVSLTRAHLVGATLTRALLPSPLEVLQCRWYICSDELTVELMRYDAANHPQPEKFGVWAKYPPMCPYHECRVGRAVNFQERPDLWSPGPAKSALELMDMLLKEHCVY